MKLYNYIKGLLKKLFTRKSDKPVEVVEPVEDKCSETISFVKNCRKNKNVVGSELILDILEKLDEPSPNSDVLLAREMQKERLKKKLKQVALEEERALRAKAYYVELHKEQMERLEQENKDFQLWADTF